jgi:hypothetical protein
VAERVRVTFDTDLRRPRLAVLLRLPLAVPAVGVVVGWTVLAFPALVVAWIAAIATGRAPLALHRFLRAYLEYALRLVAWLALVSRRYPRLHGQPVRLDVAREPQPRASVLLRPLLGLPGLVLGSAFAVVVVLGAVAAWFVALLRGRTTEGLRELGAFCARYDAEALAYLLVLTPSRPRLAAPTTSTAR